MGYIGERSRYSQQQKVNSYEEGNAVRKLQTVPQPYREDRDVEQTTKRTSERTNNNRKKAMQTNRTFVIFLAVVSIITLYTCINYLQLRAKVTNQIKQVATLETTLINIKTENDALYDKAIATVDLESIKKEAIERLGMQYATKDQVMWYSTSGNSYFRQYQEISNDK